MKKLTTPTTVYEDKQYFYVTDHLGSSAWVTDRTCFILQHIQYLPFGEIFINQETTARRFENDFKFLGKELDSETGYTKTDNRYYWAEAGVFLSVDNYSERYPFISSYAYSLNNPLNISDPSGDTVKFINELAKQIVNSLTTKGSANYSRSFTRKFNKLDKSHTVYNFEHVSSSDIWGKGGVVNVDIDGSINVKFTTGFGNRTLEEGGFSPQYAAIFEETYHAFDYDRGKLDLNNPTCMAEARAWKFATKAPGTQLSETFFDYTVAHTIKSMSKSDVASMFKYGLKPWIDENDWGHNTINKSRDPLIGLYNKLPFK